MPGMSRLLACRLIPCVSIPVRLALCTSILALGVCSMLPCDEVSSVVIELKDLGSKISIYSACVIVNSGLLTVTGGAKRVFGIDPE